MKAKILKFSKKNIIVKNSNNIILSFLCLASISIHSQKNKDIKADKEYNNFNYVSAIKNISSKDAFKYEKNAFCNQKGGGTISVFTDSAPNKFYLTYTKTQADTWRY